VKKSDPVALGRHELLSLCVHKGRLWQVSAKSPDRTWPKTSPLYRNVVGSFVPKL
jgi:hypothetical protein